MSNSPREFKFNVKAVQEDGTFEGLAAVYGNVDLGGDVIEPGAFTKTMSDRGGEITLLWQHNKSMPIGKGKLVDTADGLSISGKLALGMSAAKDAYEALKAGIVDGLSIGYDVVKREFKGQNRILKELKLWEVSLVTFPMNELARVSAFKCDEDLLHKMNEVIEDVKAGRRFSADSESAIRLAIASLSALLTTPEEGAGKSAAQQHDAEPVIHSAIDSLKATLDSFRA